MKSKRLAVALALLVGGVGYAQDKKSDDLTKRVIERRAVEAAIWGIPAVNTDLMSQALTRDTKGAVNQIVYWPRPSDWKNQTLTPNPDTIYCMPFWSTKDAGPIVIEIPPTDGGSITGNLMDVWQMPLDDVETRYVLIGVRTFVKPKDPGDVKAAHALQDGIKVEQAGTGTYEVPNWDSASRDKVREDLIKRAASFTDSRGMFGPRGKGRSDERKS